MLCCSSYSFRIFIIIIQLRLIVCSLLTYTNISKRIKHRVQKHWASVPIIQKIQQKKTQALVLVCWLFPKIKFHLRYCPFSSVIINLFVSSSSASNTLFRLKTVILCFSSISKQNKNSKHISWSSETNQNKLLCFAEGFSFQYFAMK